MTKITLTVKEAAALLGVSTTTIYAMCREGQIPHVRVRTKIIFHRDVLEDWLRQGQAVGGGTGQIVLY